jgi:RNA polymerase sigma-70 factor (ECF subfamily)
LLLPTLDFDSVFTDASPYVWRVLGRLGVARADVGDVCQEVFLVVHRRLRDYDGRVPVRSWIYGICVRTASDYRRRAYRRNERLFRQPPEPSVPASQHRQAELDEACAKLQQVLGTLDASKREVFVLYELEELSMNEIAQALDCPLQTAYSRLHAARKAVTAAYGAAPSNEETG